MVSHIWIVIPILHLSAPVVFADDCERLIRQANCYFIPLPEAVLGAENDTPERIALG